MTDTVTYARDGRLARVTIDDGKANVMSTQTLTALAKAFDRAEADGAIVVLAGRPGMFSAGFDLKVFAGGDAEVIFAMMQAGAALAHRVLSFPLPVVAACTGHAFPMGAFLLLGADVRIGAEGPYRIGLNEVAINIAVPSFGIELARQRLHPAWFQRTVLTGEMFSPADAVQAGFLDRVVPAADLPAAVKSATDDLQKIDLASHAITKRRARGPAIAAVRAAIDAEIRLEAYQARGPSRVVLPGAA
ncbi:MAG TPA: crotonase/enoyl-CoA hydratase family protein [Caulobacteraceae bacterium]|nr:crotonase/enoyl-CoA hydratase family protein [Caulobacteraceae bacterium]